MSTFSFTNHYLLATVTTSIPIGDFLPRSKNDMDQLMKNELLPVGSNGALAGGRRVFWEEGKKERTSSILDVLFPASNLTIDQILQLRYVKNKGQSRLLGATVLQKLQTGLQWRLSGAFSGPVKRSRREGWGSQNDLPDTDLEEVDEEDSVMDTDGSWSQQSFEIGQKRPNAYMKTPEEKGWERLLRSIFYAMRNFIREASDNSSSQSNSPNPLPYNVLPAPRYWSSEFSTTPIPDATDSRKPDLVLLDYRLKNRTSGNKTWADVLTGIEITKSELFEGRDIPVFLGVATKGYLMMREQPWRRFVVLFSIANLKLRAHYMDRSGMIISEPISIGPSAVRFVDVLNAMTLSDTPSLGYDPTIHVCTELCTTVPHNGLPGNIPVMPEGAEGWVVDNDNNVYWIMAVLWKSRGLFSRGTVCYRVQDQKGEEFALKDCWVDAENLEHEVTLLQAVKGVPNVVSLVKYWDVQYAGQTDCTSRIREHVREHLPAAPIYSNKVHRRMLLTPCGLPLTDFKSVTELVNVFRDLVVAHEEMVTKRHVLHGDLSPNNLIIHDGKGYFIDFDHAKFLKNNAATDSRGTGTIPYISCRLLKLMGDVPHPPAIHHKPSDDLESLFYIFLEFTTVYGGPGDEQSDKGVPAVNAERWRKAYVTMGRDGLGISGLLKKDFLTDRCPPYKLAPYFQACSPILEDWRKAIGDAINDDRDVSHGDICTVLQEGLKKMQSLPDTSASSSSAPSSAPSVTAPSPTSTRTTRLRRPDSLPRPTSETMTHDSRLRPRSGRGIQMLPPGFSSTSYATRNAIPPSASGSMAPSLPSLPSPLPPLPTSGVMIQGALHSRPRRKNQSITPAFPSLPSGGPNVIPPSGSGSMTELPSQPRRSSRKKKKQV